MVNSEFKNTSNVVIEINRLKTPTGEDFPTLFKEFVRVCRDDLDIDDALIDPADDVEFEQFIDLSTEMISDDLNKNS